PSLCERFIGGTLPMSQQPFFAKLSFFLTAWKKPGKAQPIPLQNRRLHININKMTILLRHLPFEGSGSWRPVRPSPKPQNRPFAPFRQGTAP
ncbi:hypothetical protein, partial [Hoeflea sp.]|uniref:hypothetical protein n=1 Tax=Hoeflea sp. TaxID=1940281 RepID=UPI003A8CAA35